MSQFVENDAPDLAEATGYRDTVTGGLVDEHLDAPEFSTKPNLNQPDRCPSIDPHDTLQCGRRIHDDDQCQFGGIAWKKGTPRYMSDRERADRLEAMCERLAERLAELPMLWRKEGRDVMFNRAGDDLTVERRVGKWLDEKTRVTPSGSTNDDDPRTEDA